MLERKNDDAAIRLGDNERLVEMGMDSAAHTSNTPAANGPSSARSTLEELREAINQAKAFADAREGTDCDWDEIASVLETAERLVEELQPSR